MSLVFDRSYRLSVIEQKVTYTGGSAPANIKQGYSTAWKASPNASGSPLSALQQTYHPTVFLQQDNATGNLVGVSTDTANQTKTTSGGDSVMITNLHMTAEINSAAKEGDVATSVIRVFNASKETRAKLERKNAYVILEAGYGNDVGIVFTGTSQKAFSRKQGTDIVTEIQCVDSNVQLKTSRVSFAWPPNTKYSQILTDIAGAMKEQGIATGFLETKAKNLDSLPSPAETVAKGGYSFQGLSSQLLDKVCEQFNYSWYITLNELYIHPRTFNKFTVQYDINADLMKSMEPEQESKQEVPSVETPARFKLVTFLDHRIKIGQLIRITQGQYKGLYKVISVDTRLSYLDGGGWDSEIVLEIA
jgi:hypothetical protein